MPPEQRARIEAMRLPLAAAARQRYNRTINQGPFGIDSRTALTGAKYAEAMGCGLAYHEAVMNAYWRDAQDIGDRAVLAEIAAAVGLNQDEYLAALDEPAFDARVQADVDLAHRYGLNGVPALIFDNRYLVSGAQPAEVLKQVVEQIEREREE